MAAMLTVLVEAAFCATVRMPGSLTDEDVLHSMGDAAQRWSVEYLEDAESPVWADGSNWRFRAKERATGATRTFRSGTESGYFVLARTYDSLALIGADIGSGTWGFTVYDLEADKRLVEFPAGFPHLSPDNRYLVYRKWFGRRARFDPTIKLVDFARPLGLGETIGIQYQGIGDVVFPEAAPAERPELGRAYGSVVIGSPFDDVAWNMEIGALYFTATDRTGHLNLVVLRLETAEIACYVPLTTATLRGEHVPEKRLSPKGVSLRSSSTVVVTTRDGMNVRSAHEIDLHTACWEQSREFTDSLAP